MTGVQNAFYAMAHVITRRLVGRHYKPSPRVLAVEADIVSANKETIRSAGEILGYIENLTEMRKREMNDRNSNLWELAVKQAESGWNSTGKPALLSVAPELRHEAKALIKATETALRALKIAGLH
jgi:hypothetical protein